MHPAIIIRLLGDNGSYNGEVETYGKPQGMGIFFGDGGGAFEGKWWKGQPNGEGRMVFRDDGSLERGQVHIGRFVDGICHGYGKRFDRNGRVVFDGEWVRGEMLVGNTYSKAENRRGRFMRDRDSRRHNRVDMKGSYSGEIAPWANEKDVVPHGYGVCHYDDGLTYDGYWDRGVLLDTPPLSGVTVTSSKHAKASLLGASKGVLAADSEERNGGGGGGTRPQAAALSVSPISELPADSSTRREVQLGAFVCETCAGKFRVKSFLSCWRPYFQLLDNN